MIGCRACDWDGCAGCHDAAREASAELGEALELLEYEALSY